MTRRPVPVLLVALVVLAGCTAPSTQPADTEATANGTTEPGTATTTGDGAATTDAPNGTAALESGPTPPGVAANDTDVVVNASSLLAAHERVLLADENLQFSVANVTTRDGRRVFTLTATATAGNESADATNGTYTARIVVDERGLVHAYRIRQHATGRDVTHVWTLESLGATPTRPDWVANVSDAANRTVTASAPVKYRDLPDPNAGRNGIGHARDNAVLERVEDGRDGRLELGSHRRSRAVAGPGTDRLQD